VYTSTQAIRRGARPPGFRESIAGPAGTLEIARVTDTSKSLLAINAFQEQHHQHCTMMLKGCEGIREVIYMPG
jgi:hypothetical protein